MKTFFILVFGFTVVFFALFIYSKYPVQKLFTTGNYTPTIAPVPEFQYPLFGQWRWEYTINSSGQRTTPSHPEKFILSLTPEGRLTSTTDCNTVSGSYVQNKNNLNFGAFLITEKFCRGELFESVYITQLSLVSSYVMQNDRELILNLAHSVGSMKFTRI